MYNYCHLCFSAQNETGYGMECDMLPLFELGSVHYESYLLNIRVPAYGGHNLDIGKLHEFSVIVSIDAFSPPIGDYFRYKWGL